MTNFPDFEKFSIENLKRLKETEDKLHADYQEFRRDYGIEMDELKSENKNLAARNKAYKSHIEDLVKRESELEDQVEQLKADKAELLEALKELSMTEPSDSYLGSMARDLITKHEAKG